MKGETMTPTPTIPVTGSAYGAPVWSGIEALAPLGADLGAAMYYGSLDTLAGTAHGYKHADLRRTIYVLPELVCRWRGLPDGSAVLVPFDSPADAVAWWMS